MHWLTRLGRRLRLLARRTQVERDMDREMRDHIAAEIADRVAQGMPADQARRTTLVDFGGLEAIKEDARDARGVRMLEDAASDLRYGLRVLRRAPWFTALAILTFALGTGASTAIFSVVYGVLLRPLPYAAPDRLVALWEHNLPRDRDRNVVASDNFAAWRDRTQSFTGMAALVPSYLTLTEGGTPERAVGAEVSPGFFSLLGVAPELGRDFTEDDARAGSSVILSHGVWQQRYGGDEALVGRAIRIGERTLTVTGVMPASFEPPAFGWMGAERFWLPMALTAANADWGRYLHVIGRLRPEVDLERARTEMLAIASQRAVESSGNEGWSASVVPLAEQIAGDARPILMALLVGVTLMLAMAVTNVAALTLSAMRRRTRELAVRRAVGATDARLFRQLFVQSALVGVLGIATGLLLAVPATRWLILMLPPDMPRAASIALDVPVLAIVAGANLLATLVFGTIAARRGRRAASMPLVGRQGGDPRATAGPGGAALVTLEIAVGLAISVMALLMVRSVASLERVDLGFDPEGVLAVRISAPEDRAPTPDSQRAFFDRIVERVEAIGGVTSAAIISARPFGGIGPATSVGDALTLPVQGEPATTADIRFVDAAALPILRVSLVAGEPFDEATDTEGPPRVIISRELARQIWPSADAVGRRLRINLFEGITPEVVGIVDDVYLSDQRTAPRAVAWLSARRFTDTRRDVVIRTSVPPLSIVPALRAAIDETEPGLPVERVESMSSLVAAALATDRFTTFLLSVFAAVSVTLAGIGIFGVFSADVVRRRKEIGLRLALGGSSRGVLALLLAHAARRAAVGLAAGLLLAVLLGVNMRALLFGVEPTDPLSMGLVAITLAAMAAVATLIPAAQALRGHPLAALRDE